MCSARLGEALDDHVVEEVVAHRDEVRVGAREADGDGLVRALAAEHEAERVARIARRGRASGARRWSGRRSKPTMITPARVAASVCWVIAPSVLLSFRRAWRTVAGGVAAPVLTVAEGRPGAAGRWDVHPGSEPVVSGSLPAALGYL